MAQGGRCSSRRCGWVGHARLRAAQRTTALLAIAAAISSLGAEAQAPGPAAAAGARAPRADDLLGFRRIDDLAWSPDGSRLLFTVTHADTARRRWLSDVWMWDGRATHEVVATAAHEYRGRWSPDGRLIAFLMEKDSQPQIFTVSARGSDPIQLTRAPRGVEDFDWMPDGLSLAFTAVAALPDDSTHRPADRRDPVVSRAGDRWAHLWRVDVRTLGVTELAHVAGALSRPRARPGGSGHAPGDVLVEWRPTGRADDLDLSDLLLVHAGGRIDTLTLGNPGSDWDAAWSGDGASIVYLANLANANANTVARLTISGAAAAGRIPRLYDALSGYDAAAPAMHGGEVSAIVGRGLSARVWRVAGDGVSGGTFDGRASKAEPGTPDSTVVTAAEWTADGKLLATVRSSSGLPVELYVSDGRGPGTPVTHLNAVPYPLASTRVVRWHASDGLALEGMLVLPPGYTGGAPLPTLVRVHGGPYGKYDWSFDPLAQLLAGHGFAVFEPNFRGSEGSGEQFSLLIRGDYGGKNHTDILSGLDSLIAAGVADSGRLGIFGWSFGGFSTNWMVTQTGRFKAAVAGAGMTDMLSHYGTSDIQRYREFMSYGAPWDSAAARYLWERSPLRLAPRVTTPLLMLHGESDRRVAISQSEEFFTALRRLRDRGGPAVELVRYPREPHTFREPLHQVDRDRRILEWFERYVRSP